MKQIIEGKRYDTETATAVAKWHNGRSSNDFHYLWEELYRTPKGNWFISYDGGALTDYRESCGNNSWSGSSGIKALSPGEAKEWLEAHHKVEALETYFSDQLEDA
jgi:hypothetical protein